MTRIRMFALLGITGLIGLACQAPNEPRPVTLPRDLTTQEVELLESTDRFGLKLFREVVRQQPDSNIFISPLSVSMALGMTANGAAGTTFDSMRATLELTDLTEEESNQAYHSLMELLPTVDPRVRFDAANSIWYRLGELVVAGFLQRCRDYFAAQVRELDFSTPDAADTINAWVKENTHGKIDEIVRKPIGRDIVMFLINAIYFKGTWTYEFDPGETQDDEFTILDGTTVACKMMKQENEFLYLETDRFQAVDLPYGDGLFSMTLLLPDQGVPVDSVIARMTPDNWRNWLAGMDTAEGALELPRFRLEYKLKMNDVLKALGMGNAFDSGVADFTRMFHGGGVWIDEVRHKTFVQVDEEGTEAAAVTVVVMIRSESGGFHMRVDRPFVFVIRERTSGAMLFMGKIVEPVWEE